MFFSFNLKRAVTTRFTSTLSHIIATTIGAILTITSISASADDSFTQRLVSKAMDLVGVKYRFGGTSPATGLDCSGYVQYVFKSAGVSLPRVSAEMGRTGQAVGTGNMAPGDLVFFNTRGFANSHVGIYLGNSMFIHSPRSGRSVSVESMDIPYWKSRFNGARRVSGNNSNPNSFTGNAPQGM